MRLLLFELHIGKVTMQGLSEADVQNDAMHKLHDMGFAIYHKEPNLLWTNGACKVQTFVQPISWPSLMLA